MVIKAWTFFAASSVVLTVSPKSAYENPTPILVGCEGVKAVLRKDNLRLVQEEDVRLGV